MRTKYFKAPVLIIVFVLSGFFTGCDTEEGQLPEIGDRTRTSASLTAFDSCVDLENALKENLKEEMRAMVLSWKDVKYVLDFEESGGAAPPSDGNIRQEGTDYSGTNNQEEGVDEADFIKTDGYSIYLLNGDQFIVLGVPEFGQLEQEASIKLEGTPGQMLIAKDNSTGLATKAVVFSTIYTWNIDKEHPVYEFINSGNNTDHYCRTSILTKLTMIDLADPETPVIIQELY